MDRNWNEVATQQYLFDRLAHEVRTQPSLSQVWPASFTWVRRSVFDPISVIPIPGDSGKICFSFLGLGFLVCKMEGKRILALTLLHLSWEVQSVDIHLLITVQGSRLVPKLDKTIPPITMELHLDHTALHGECISPGWLELLTCGVDFFWEGRGEIHKGLWEGIARVEPP